MEWRFLRRPDDVTRSAQVERDLEDLAGWLRSNREEILRSWRAAADADPELSTASTLTRAQFHDHIPDVLDAFDGLLRSSGPREAANATEAQRSGASGHGLQRWQQGYQQREVMREWRHLHLILLDLVERYGAEHGSADPRALRLARRSLAELCAEGVCESADQYARLHRAEAAGRVGELEAALRSFELLDRERGEVLRETAHDLRGSLGVVHNAAQALHEPALPERARARSMKLLLDGVASVRALLDDLMSLARLEAGHEERELARVDVAVLLSKLAEEAESLAAERGLVLAREGPASLVVETDAIKVRRIAQNLLMNALQYTERGGVRLVWDDRDAERWTLTVQDTGPGLRAVDAEPMVAAIARATEEAPADDASSAPPAPLPSLSAKLPRGYGGEGIGLSIVKRLCDLLDASITVETAPGAGSSFTVTFPRSYPSP